MPNTFKRISAESLYVSKPTHWLESRFHFSFAEYYNPHNTNFGVLRVMNDDLVKPKEGFGKHPHQNQEIVSFVVKGLLAHADSKGNKETLSRGAIQYMSAGAGVYHSEYNDSPTETVRFIQIWIKPNARNLPVQYGSRSYDPTARLNRLQHVVCPFGEQGDNSTLIGIHQDANIFVSEIEPGKTINYALKKERQAYFLCIEGEVNIEGTNIPSASVSLNTRDGLEIIGPVDMAITSTANENALILMVEMKKE